MTIPPETALGGEQLLRGDDRRIEELRRDSEQANSLTEVGLAIGGAFLFYRLYMVKHLRREVRAGLTSTQLTAATEYYFRKFLPIWSYITVPAIVRAMILGSPDRQIPDELIFAMADDYARRVGSYLNDSSKEALLEGFNAHLNKRANRVVAANKAIDGFGLTKKQTRALVVRKDRKPVASVLATNLDRDREMYVEQAVFSRALTVGDNESYGASQHGKQIGWMFLLREGRISTEAKRVWITTRDEKTCKLCGPMHRKSAPIDEPFDTPAGQVWAPSLHPNCRCTMTLRGSIRPELVSKELYGGELAEFNRKVRRDDDGKFTFKPKVKERDPVDPRVAEMLRAATELKSEPQKVELPQKVDLRRATISQVSLPEKIDLSQMKASGLPKGELPKLDLPKLDLATLSAKAELLPNKVSIPKATVAPPRAHQAKPRGSKDLGYEASHFDGANAIFPVDEPIHPGITGPIIFTENQAFYDPDTTAEFMQVGYEQMADQLVNKFVRHGTVKDDKTGVRLQLSPDLTKRLILAVMDGADDIEVKTFAAATGISRYNHAARVYHVRDVYPDAKHLAEGYVIAPGPYIVEDTMQIAGRGLPIEHVYLRPMTDEEYQDWYDQREHRG